MRPTHCTFWICVAMGCALPACGYSEAEWQAQLGKYNALTAAYQDQRNQSAALQQTLAAAKSRVEDLEHQLGSMGVDVSKLNQALESKGKTLDELNTNLADTRKALEDYKARARVLEAIKARMLELRRKLDALTQLGLRVNIRRNRMIISLPGDILFDTGKTDLKDKGKEVLLKVADVVRNDRTLMERDFQVTGHTDNAPVAPGRPYIDNWGLSLMRAREVLTFLIAPVAAPPKPGAKKPADGGGGLPASHWSAAGNGQSDPVAQNDSPANMQKNRRVEIVVIPNVEEMIDLKSLTQVP